jgi:rhamnosyltransferase
LIVFDSGSTDGSVDLICKAQPKEFIQLASSEYVPGRVMNQGMRLARSNYCIFVNADATPQGSDWLGPLVQALSNPNTAAVFGRQVPRPDCQAVYACDYERCFGANRESARWEHFFSMVNSGVRKDIWSRRGFLETIQYAEDDEYTRWCRSQGYAVVYCPQSVVMHSHNYSPADAYKRSFGDAKALAASWPGRKTDFNFLRTLLLGWASDLRHDIAFCRRSGRMRELAHAARVRWRQRRGRLDGFRSGWAAYRAAGK